MRRRIAIIAFTGTVFGAALTSLLITIPSVSPAAPSQVYPVGNVQDGLRYNPRAWVGRTVLVQGIVQEVAWKQGAITALVAAGPGKDLPFTPPSGLSRDAIVHLFLRAIIPSVDNPYRPLQLRVQQAQTTDPLPPVLRGLPWVRQLIPAPQRVLGGTPAIYRIHLLARPQRDKACFNLSCDDGVLLTVIRW